MITRVIYPNEIKMKAVEIRLASIPMKQVLNVLNIRHRTQVETWMRGYKNGEAYRFEQPLGKQYTFLKNPEHESEQAKLKADNRNLKQQIEVIKKYAELERKWLEKWL